MAILCREYQLLFIMTPRTACTAIGDLLGREYGGEYCPSEDLLDASGRIIVQKKHSTLEELLKHGIFSAKEIQSLFKFAAVRNPFDSLLSLYLKQRSKYQPLLDNPDSWVNRLPTYAKNMRYAQTHSFEQWLLRKCIRQCGKRFLGAPRSMFHDYTSGTDAIMRYESMDKDLEDIFKRAGMRPAAKIPVLNRTAERSGRDYRPFYSPFTRGLVRFVYADDLRKYGYAFNQ